MICTKCNKPTELNKGFFKPAGMVPGLNMKRSEFVCNACTNAIDVTSKNPSNRPAPETKV